MKKKTIVFIVVGGILVLTFSFFAVLLVKFRRGSDPNNEDAVLAEAKAAAERDDPPAVAGAYRRLTKLNPFNKEYADAYAHALIRMRDFKTLAAYTNEHPMTVELTEDELRTQELIDRSLQMASLGSNEVSVAELMKATNINYYAATPLLISSYARIGRFDLALDTVRPYVRRFPLPGPLVRAAEWCTLAKRTDLLQELRNAVPKGAGRFQLVFAYYCDALEAWDKSDKEELVKAMNAVGTDIRTPLARLLKLEAVALGDDADRVEQAYRELRESQPPFDFPTRGKMAVKRFIAAHFPSKEFPDRKFDIAKLGKLADLVLEGGNMEQPDDKKNPDLLRVSLLAKMANKTLSQFEIDKALEQFPDDKAIQYIYEQYKRNAAEEAKIAADADAADEAKIDAAAKDFARREAAAEAKAAAAVKAAEEAKAAEAAKAAEGGKE